MTKKILSLITCTLLFVACGGGDDAGPTTPTGSEYLNVSNIDIPSGNTTATLNIQASNNCDWIITWSDSWIRSINPTKGRGSQNVTITVNVNPSATAERTAVVTVKNTSGTITRNITVTQSPNAEQLTVLPTSLSFTAEGGSQEITVTSNTHWSIQGRASWMELSKSSYDGNSTVTVSVSPNTSSSIREAVLIISTAEGSSEQVAVTQAGKKEDNNWPGIGDNQTPD